jgi:hypothetical protein
MLPSDHADRIIQGVRQGRYSLLLGAGFSVDSESVDGTPLPTGNALADELALKFDLPEKKYPLASLTDVIEANRLNGFFQARFRDCKPSDSAKLVSSFVWKLIFTFNIDDVLNAVYSEPNSLQRAKLLSFRRPYEEPEDPAELRIVHLHGSVRLPDDGYVFSAQEYGAVAAQDSTWFKIASDTLLTQPFIVIGCTLAESDLEYYFARRQGLIVEGQQVFPSLFVTRTLDVVLQKRCQRLGLIPIQSTSSEFLKYLDSVVENRPSPLELVLPSKNQPNTLFQNAPSERAQRIFFRQWLLVEPDNLPQRMQISNSSQLSLLRGTEPSWDHLSRNDDIIRQDSMHLLSEITTWINNPSREPRIRLLESAAGEGKSAILMRTALELAKSGHPVFFYTARERLVHEVAGEFLSSLKKPIILAIDFLAEHAIQVAQLVTFLAEAKIPYFLISSERTQRISHIINAFHSTRYNRKKLTELSRPEAKLLIAKMRNEGLLGQEAKHNDEFLAQKLIGKDLFSSIVSIGGSRTTAESIIKSEWDSFDSEAAKVIYSAIAITHYCGYPLKVSLLQRATNTPTKNLFEQMQGCLAGNIVWRPPMGEYVETRHRVRAEALLKIMSPSYRFNGFVGLARAISPYVNRTSIMRGSIEARISGRLLDYDDTVRPLLQEKSEEFYRAIQDEWKWNSRYWEQMALLELARDPAAALRFAEHAVGIELHPHTLTTLAKVQFAVAKSSRSFDVAAGHIRDAIQTAERAIGLRIQRKRAEVHTYDLVIRSMIDMFSSKFNLSQLRRLELNTITKIDNYFLEAMHFYPRDEYDRLYNKWFNIKNS